MLLYGTPFFIAKVFLYIIIILSELGDVLWTSPDINKVHCESFEGRPTMRTIVGKIVHSIREGHGAYAKKSATMTAKKMI